MMSAIPCPMGLEMCKMRMRASLSSARIVVNVQNKFLVAIVEGGYVKPLACGLTLGNAQTSLYIMPTQVPLQPHKI